ncbi:MAG: hypothetical protein ABI855_05840 [Bacteroidota bacterium]
MLKKQTSLRNKYGSILDVLLRFLATFLGYEPMVNAKDDLTGKVQQIDTADAAQRKLLKSFTKDKKIKKQKQAVKAKAVAKKVSAFAFDKGDTTLVGLMKISFSRLLYSNSKAAQTYAKTIYDAAFAMAPADKLKYEITDAELLDLKNARDLYSAAISAPRDQLVIRKVATDSLPGLFRDAEAIVDERLSNLIANYQFSDPEFYEQYQNSLIEINFNRYTAIEGEIIDTDSGEDLSDVKVVFTSSDKTFQEMSDRHGGYLKQQIDPDLNWDVTYELDGYDIVSKKVKDLVRGKHKILNVELKKKTV